MQEQEKPHERSERHQRGEYPIELIFDPEEGDRGLNRRQDAARRGPERDAHALLQDEREAERGHNGERGHVMNGRNDHALDQRPERKADDRRDQECEPETAGRLQRGPGENGTDHEEVAVREVDNVKQPEDDGKPERDQGDDQAPDQTVHAQ